MGWFIAKVRDGKSETSVAPGSTTSETLPYALGGVSATERIDTGGASLTTYTFGDNVGSATMTVDTAGETIANVRCLPFGEERWNEVDMPTTDRGYTAQRNEQGFGLMDYNARYNSPILDRFISPDSYVPESQGVQAWDRYAYVNNNPVKYIDPTGHIVCGTDEKSCPELPKWNYGEVLDTSTAQAMDVITASACFFFGCNVNPEEHSVEMGYGLPAPMPGVVIIEPVLSAALMAGEEDIVYRVIRPDQHPSVLEEGILAKNINADVAPQ